VRLTSSQRERDGARSSGARILATVGLVGLGVGGVVAMDRTMASDQPSDVVFVEEYPTPGTESAPEPLGTPAATPRGGSHAFVATQDDGVTPVAYDPCRPVHYVIRPDYAPRGGIHLVREAVDEVAGLTGLHFVYDGVTTEAPSAGRPPFQPDRYGDRWAPVLVSWAGTDEVPDLAGRVAGQGGSLPVETGGTAVFVTGSVELDADEFARLAVSPGGPRDARAIVLHELGHLVGLDHVSETDELMHATSTHAVGFGPGDRAGLAALGRGACVPEL
jgi:Matrixin